MKACQEKSSLAETRSTQRPTHLHAKASLFPNRCEHCWSWRCFRPRLVLHGVRGGDARAAAGPRRPQPRPQCRQGQGRRRPVHRLLQKARCASAAASNGIRSNIPSTRRALKAHCACLVAEWHCVVSYQDYKKNKPTQFRSHAIKAVLDPVFHEIFGFKVKHIKHKQVTVASRGRSVWWVGG